MVVNVLTMLGRDRERALFPQVSLARLRNDYQNKLIMTMHQFSEAQFRHKHHYDQYRIPQYYRFDF